MVRTTSRSFFLFADNTPAFASECNCQPRCERETYPVQVSTAPLSEYSNYKLKLKDTARENKRYQIEQLWVSVSSFVLIQVGKKDLGTQTPKWRPETAGQLFVA